MTVQLDRTGALRRALLGTVGGACLLVGAGAAAAQAGGSGAVTNWSGVERGPQIVIANPGTPTTARDPENVTGVGQMVIDQRNGFIGLCTATLINPRTVIFAAHCVNERAANAYGAASGGQPIGFGFSNNNNAAGNSAFGGWLANYQTNTSRYMFNSNYVAYNPASLEPAANEFLYGDVAVASLDTVARGVPTWSMLFSALPATNITAGGTGYHVNLAGYGNNGTGTTGSTGGSDFRRRLAENMLGGLASIDDFETFLFGGAPGGLPQNLYWIDFDDPRRGTAQASPFDFNAWRDNALPREGITASGDSGGPLILDNTFAKPVVIGVLSGGYTRFFNGQPPNGYGTASFYQPLYLYWDWIAANNPYHYVSARAGDANWNDASHWVTQLDPNYQIIGPNGQLLNGLPTDPGQGPRGADSNGFGQTCFQSGGVSTCRDIATGVQTTQAKPIGTGATSSDAVVPIDSVDEQDEARVGSDDGDTIEVVREAQAGAGGGVGPSALPPATLQNGLPGATNFVPVNFDGNRLTSTPPRYFDVTLAANGVTTLDTAVVIDRLTLAGAGAGLNITSTGSLTSNIDITQLIGTLRVDGALRTPGDMFMMAGGLSGGGAITTPFFTNMAGVIAPGTPDTIGTLTFNGNVILASGGALLINLGPNATSDRLVVNATQFSGQTPLDGKANLGGLVAFGFTAGTTPRYGDVYTFLTAQGGVTGAFQSVGALSAILRPALTYSSTSVRVTIEAGLYRDVVGGQGVRGAYAQLLDQNRTAYSRFASIYGPLDMQTAAQIGASLDGLAPGAETLKTAIGQTALDSVGRFYRDRLSSVSGRDMDGQLELIGRPVDYALSALDAMGESVSRSPVDGAGETTIVPGALPDNMRAYLAAGYLDGRAAPMPTGLAGGKDEFDGYFIAGGVETAVGHNGMVGASLSSTDLSGSTSALPQQAEGRLWQGTVYGKTESERGLILSGQLSLGRLNTETQRLAAVGPTIFTLTSEDEATVMAAEFGAAVRVVGDQITVTPSASVRASQIEYNLTTETGGGPALTYRREATSGVEGRLGVAIAANSPTFRPWVSAAVVHAFNEQPSVVAANFVGGVGPDALFPLVSTDKDWAEVGFGLNAVHENWRVTVAADTTLGRDDVEAQTYRASVSYRF
jgi:hypothetical protein